MDSKHNTFATSQRFQQLNYFHMKYLQTRDKLSPKIIIVKMW